MHGSLLNNKMKLFSEPSGFTGLCAMVNETHTSSSTGIYMTATSHESGISLILGGVGNAFIPTTNHYVFGKTYSTVGRLNNLIRLTGKVE